MKIFVITRANLCILAMSVIMALSVTSMISRTDIVPASAMPVSDKVIVLDAGHGASDGGAVGISGAPEKEINLAIALRLQKLLEQTGATVIVTRGDDNPIAGSKREDMRTRKSIKESSDGDIFVSIHMNKFPQSKYKGAQVFYADNDKSKELGCAIQEALRSILDPQNNREAKNAKTSIYLLKESEVPSVLVECGFLSNAQEEELLNTAEYRGKVAWAIYSGITDYFEGE